MGNYNQHEISGSFEARAQQHAECAKIATEPDIIQFHTQLSTHYDRLAKETRELITPRTK